jgi:hypothetical protein
MRLDLELLLNYFEINFNVSLKRNLRQDEIKYITKFVRELFLFHPVSNFNTLRHQFESGKTQKTAGRRLSVAIGNTKVTIAITIIQV